MSSVQQKYLLFRINFENQTHRTPDMSINVSINQKGIQILIYLRAEQLWTV